MPVLRLNAFGGELPQIDEHLLGPTQAVKARNVKLWNGTLKPMSGAFTVQSAASASNPLTIFKYDATTWFEWTSIKDVARSPAPNDAFKRVYFTGDGTDYPRVTDSSRAVGAAPYPTNTLRVGVPAPTVAPGASVSGTGSGTAETRFYIYTYVNSYGEEGPPSPKSAGQTVQPGQTVNLTFTAPPGAPYNITKIYIYRSNTAGASAVYQYVASVTLPTVTYADNILSADLSLDTLPSATWDPPPADMIGLTNIPGSFQCGFRKNELLMSEPGLPHAYPVDYRKSVDFDIVGLSPTDNGFVILTKGQPYIAVGSHPAALAISAVSVPFSCLTRRGIVSVGGATIYPSPLGLVRIAPGEATLITEGVLDLDDWKLLNPSTIRAFRWRDLYVAFYTGVTGVGGLVINPFRPQDGVVFFDGFDIGGAYVDPEDGEAYVSYNSQIAKWDAGAIWAYTWKSRPFTLENPAAIHIARVRAVSYPVTLVIYRDGQAQARAQIGSSDPVRVMNGALGSEYAVEITAEKEVREILLASNMKEIQQLETQVPGA